MASEDKFIHLWETATIAFLIVAMIALSAFKTYWEV